MNQDKTIILVVIGGILLLSFSIAICVHMYNTIGNDFDIPDGSYYMQEEGRDFVTLCKSGYQYRASLSGDDVLVFTNDKPLTCPKVMP